MLGRVLERRKLLTTGALALLAGCAVVPKAPPTAAPPPEQPSSTTLPSDTQRHRIALLVPMTGSNGAVGQSIANATTMALLDTNASNLRITTYDTATGASAAAQKAVADGNKLILGPLLGDDVAAVSAATRTAKIPVISYSNDIRVASRNAFIMGSLPAQSITRTVRYARAQGVNRFAALIPTGDYGAQASAALLEATRANGGTVVAMETFDRTNASVASAARRLRDKGGYDAVLIADSGRIANQAATLLKPDASSTLRILGTELWSGESSVATSRALRGAWYSAVSDARFRQFSDSYKSRFGAAPYRISTLGYDSVLLTLRVARNWKPGTNFPTSLLADKGGFVGLDGPFRFGANGAIDRAFEVREVRATGTAVVNPAPARFVD